MNYFLFRYNSAEFFSRILSKFLHYNSVTRSFENRINCWHAEIFTIDMEYRIFFGGSVICVALNFQMSLTDGRE